MKRTELMAIVDAVASRDVDAIRSELDVIASAGDTAKVGTWAYHAQKLAAWIDSGFAGTAPFAIFRVDGNIKLPFVAFSALALATCPGAGECKDFCYSLRSWRYPSPFFRQVQNTLLLWHNPQAIVADMSALLDMPRFRDMPTVDVRLYVDGDIDSLQTAKFWFDELLPMFPKLRAYGYSKSFAVLRNYAAAGYTFPSNYVLNLSSGSIHDGDADMLETMRGLPITRGRFVAVPIDGTWSAAKGDYATKAYRDAVREAFDGKAFVCPGRCGTCTGAGHACGNPNLNIPIAIGLH